MERPTLHEEFDTNAVRLRETHDLIDRKLYFQIIDNILDEWNRGVVSPVQLEGLGTE